MHFSFRESALNLICNCKWREWIGIEERSSLGFVLQLLCKQFQRWYNDNDADAIEIMAKHIISAVIIQLNTYFVLYYKTIFRLMREIFYYACYIQRNILQGTIDQSNVHFANFTIHYSEQPPSFSPFYKKNACNRVWYKLNGFTTNEQKYKSKVDSMARYDSREFPFTSITHLNNYQKSESVFKYYVSQNLWGRTISIIHVNSRK